MLNILHNVCVLLFAWVICILKNIQTFKKFKWNFRMSMIFRLILIMDGWGISCKIDLRWMSLDLHDKKSTLDQVTAWCHTDHQQTWLLINSLWPSSTRSGLTLAQAMASCLTASNHYLTNIEFSSKVFCGIHLRAVSRITTIQGSCQAFEKIQEPLQEKFRQNTGFYRK